MQITRAIEKKKHFVENQYLTALHTVMQHQFIVRIYNLYFNQIYTRVEERFDQIETYSKVSSYLRSYFLRLGYFTLEITTFNLNGYAKYHFTKSIRIFVIFNFQIFLNTKVE